MKKNAVKLGLLLYSSKKSSGISFNLATVKELVPALTSGGQRSLLYHLEREKIFFSQRVLGSVQYSLTEKGHRQLKASFPALDSTWDTYNGEWQCLVFQKAPESDSNFRYLRSQLIREHSIQLSRGVYCTPGMFSSKLLEVCHTLYQGSVVIFSVDSWDFGFEQSTIIKNLSLADFVDAYSGISNELDRLLLESDKTRSLNDQAKKQFFSVYDRFRDLLSDDSGIASFYYPKTPSALDILAKLQQLLVTF